MFARCAWLIQRFYTSLPAIWRPVLPRAACLSSTPWHPPRRSVRCAAFAGTLFLGRISSGSHVAIACTSSVQTTIAWHNTLTWLGFHAPNAGLCLLTPMTTWPTSRRYLMALLCNGSYSLQVLLWMSMMRQWMSVLMVQTLWQACLKA